MENPKTNCSAARGSSSRSQEPGRTARARSTPGRLFIRRGLEAHELGSLADGAWHETSGADRWAMTWLLKGAESAAMLNIAGAFAHPWIPHMQIRPPNSGPDCSGPTRGP
jgi:hypothetical protein